MTENKKVGVYFCGNGFGEAGSVDFSSLMSFVKGQLGVGLAKDLGSISKLDVEKLSQEIKQNGINRIVIAGDSPGFHKAAFSKALLLSDAKAENVFLANFREHGAVVKDSTERAKAIVACAVQGVPFELAAQPSETTVCEETLVVGAGIAGIQAALEIANAGHKVYLLEKTGTIGGHMAMFDKTFPTLDCAACILTPKMVEVGQHPNIEIMTVSELKSLSGDPGNYTAKIHQKARCVNLATCIGCGICAETCPGKAPSEFDAEITDRKSIYIPFPQAVPNKYLVDKDSCIYHKNGKCRVCEKKCPVPDCINLDEEDKEVELKVGNVIVATGFEPFDAARATQFGYGQYPNVIDSLQFERLINASGPTDGNIKLQSQDKKGRWVFSKEGDEPKSVAIVHCIGSRDHNYNKYCSRVCCMYSLKFAHLVQEKLPTADVYEYYIDMRAFGKGYEEFYDRIKGEGINVIRGRSAKVEKSGDALLLRSEDIHKGTLIAQELDMVILSVGLESCSNSKDLASLLGITCDCDGWFIEAHQNSNPVGTYKGGIYVAGVCQGPKDIPDTVAQASAAASRVLSSIESGKLKKSVADLSVDEVQSQAGSYIRA